MKILKYRCLIDTECEDNKLAKPKKALKIDGYCSLKMDINCKDFKSCDYLRYKKSEIILIEISNLEKQFMDIESKSSLLTKVQKKQLGNTLSKRIEPMSIIRDELRDKYIQTDLILHKLTDHLQFNIKKSKTYIIAICSNNQSSVIMFQCLLYDLKSSLKLHSKDIKIICVKDLVNYI